MHVPASVHADQPPALSARVSGRTLQDGPRAVTQVRNDLVHPKDTRSLSETPGLVSESARLACRYQSAPLS